MLFRSLLTGFATPAAHKARPSGDLLPLIMETPPVGVIVRTQLLPVDPEGALLKAIEAMDRLLPDAVIGLGPNEGQPLLCVERIAINVDDREGPPRAGRRGGGELIDAAGPAAYFSTLPVHTIVEKIKSGGVPATVSNSAGTFLCNRLFYALLHYVSLRGQESWFKRRPPAGLTSRIGFIRLPTTPELAGLRGEAEQALPLETTLEGVRLAVEAVVAFVSSSETRPAEEVVE